MTDIVKHLRKLTIGSHAAVLWSQANDAADEIERLRAELADLHERLAFAESREVCTVAHENVDTCGYCQRDALAARLAEEQEFSRQQVRLVAAHASEGERLEARLAEAERLLRLWQDDPYKAAWPTIEFLRPTVSASAGRALYERQAWANATPWDELHPDTRALWERKATTGEAFSTTPTVTGAL